MRIKKKHYCGIDVASQTLAVYFCKKASEGPHYFEVENNIKGFRVLVNTVGLRVHYVLEATGVLHHRLISYFTKRKITFSIINGLQTKRFGQLQLNYTKTDSVDAKRIFEYSEYWHPEPFTMPPLDFYDCQSLNYVLQDLTRESTRLANHLFHMRKRIGDYHFVYQLYELKQRRVKSELMEVETRLLKQINLWKPTELALLLSINGIGKRTAVTLLLHTQGRLTEFTSRQLIARTGLHPIAKQSGTSILMPKRIARTGGKHLRNQLFMCALTARTTNPICAELYNRLIKKGKCKMVALTAVSVKLLKIAYGVLKNQRPFDPNYQSVHPHLRE